MKLVCHIGSPKTASTFLQNTLALNPDWLRAHGVMYPDLLAPDANHITLFYAAANYIHDFARGYGLHTQEDVDKFRDRLSETIARQVAEAPEGVHTMVMSSENLVANLRGRVGVQNLAELLRPHFDDIRIVIYLRRQDDAILSMYGEFMRRGFSDATFEQFMERVLGGGPVMPYLAYEDLLKQWIAVFGRKAITVRLFDRKRMRGGDILSDFMAQVLGEVPQDIAGLTPSQEDNIGLSAPALEFLRRMQPHLPFIKDGKVNPVRARLQKRINELPSKPRPRMTAEQSQRVMEHFRSSNEWLGKAFFPKRKGPIFPVRTDLPETSNLGRVTLVQFAKFAGSLLE
ncbi:MAG: hypothetical protein ACP5DX_16495 [Paracoccaceae bacterium]